MAMTTARGRCVLGQVARGLSFLLPRGSFNSAPTNLGRAFRTVASPAEGMKEQDSAFGAFAVFSLTPTVKLSAHDMSTQ